MKHTYIQFNEAMHNTLQHYEETTGANLFSTLLSAFRVLLYRYNNQEDIQVRHLTDKHSLSYTIAPIETTGGIQFISLCDHTKATATTTICLNNATCHHTKCRVMFVMQQSAELSADISPTFEFDGDESSFDLAFIVTESIELGGIVKYNTRLYTQNMIEQMVAHYKQLLHSIIKDPYQNICTLPMLTAAEEHELLEVFNDTEKPYAAEKTLADLFEEQVNKTPSNAALYIDDAFMTYDELNKKANQLAHYLIAHGVQKEDNVGLLVNRSFHMITAMLAILKAGAAYVPVTPDYPLERQEHMLKQSNVKFILSNIDNYLNSVTGRNVIDMRTAPYDQYSCDNPGLHIDSRQLAYTIYTSGSTGVPKGVMIEHYSAVNLITWVNTEFNVTENDRLLFITSMGFDLSVYDIFGMLATGGSLVIVRKEDVPNSAKLAELMQRFQITFWDSVPTTMDHLVSRLSSTDPGYRQLALRLVFLSGDWIPVNLPDKIRNYFPNTQVISLGGATEGTVWSNYYPIASVSNEWRSIPYGKPITNNAFYILDDNLQPVPNGVVGELFIGGVGVARGYANDEEKTCNAFLQDPFTNKWGGKMYRTGDLGRMLPNGNMEFIGRKDNQVKILGHRVELGEIESVIRQQATINSAIVLYHADKKQLVSYIVPGKYYDRDTIIAQMKKKLPDYMIPGKWVELDHMPLTTNGKTDTKALYNIDTQEQLKSEYVPPGNELEITLVEIWQQILGAEKLGVLDNFFDMGGQSLLALELATEMEKKTCKELPVNVLYKYPTIAQLATFMQGDSVKKKWKSLVAIKSSGDKMPVYIVHGDGLSLSNFHNLGMCLDNDQPVFSLQPIGLNGSEKPLENIAEIATHYINEILDHNPTGPYALGGYSFGGYVAIEMKRQLELMGKTVKMLAIFDTDAENVTYKKGWITALPRKIKRQIPKFLFIAKSIITRPLPTIKYQYTLLSKRINRLCYTLGIKENPELKGINMHISRINETNLRAFRNYELTPFNDKIYLFKAKSRMYFVDDFKYLGWTNYAQRGVDVYEVPGDHRTMFQPPNVSELARVLQQALDNC